MAASQAETKAAGFLYQATQCSIRVGMLTLAHVQSVEYTLEVPKKPVGAIGRTDAIAFTHGPSTGTGTMTILRDDFKELLNRDEFKACGLMGSVFQVALGFVKGCSEKNMEKSADVLYGCQFTSYSASIEQEGAIEIKLPFVFASLKVSDKNITPTSIAFGFVGNPKDS